MKLWNTTDTDWDEYAGAVAFVSDTAYGSGWNGDTTVAPSKNAVYDGLAPKDLSAVLASASATLTATTPNSTSFVQWGTEEAVVAQADAPVSAVVLAWASGVMRPGPGTITSGSDRGNLKLQASFDGGSSWADIGQTQQLTLVTTNTTRGVDASAVGRGIGTVTGDIQVRAMVSDNDAANDTTWFAGFLMVLVHPQ